MPLFQWLIQRLIIGIDRHGWKAGALIFLLLYLCSWGLMELVEPPESPILEEFWWYYLVTASTVGYGDMTPMSIAGKWIGVTIIFGSVTAFGVVTAQLVTFLSNFSAKVRSGTMHLREENHVVILGYHAGKTERIVEELTGDSTASTQNIVVVFDPNETHESPIPENSRVQCVKGDLTGQLVRDRACVETASAVIADGKDDNETLAICLVVCKFNHKAHLVAALHSLEDYTEKIHLIRSSIECVPSSMVTMIVQACQDPGITRLYRDLLSNLRGAAGFRTHIPETVGKRDYCELLCEFKKRHNALIIGVTTNHGYDSEILENPPWDYEVKGGMSLYYIAPQRLTNVQWQEMFS